jgi:hypothetical protein
LMSLMAMLMLLHRFVPCLISSSSSCSFLLPLAPIRFPLFSLVEMCQQFWSNKKHRLRSRNGCCLKQDFVTNDDYFQKNARQNPRDCRDFDEQPANCVRNRGEGQHNWAVAGPVGQGGEHRRRRQQGPTVQDQGWHQLLPNANVLGELQSQI